MSILLACILACISEVLVRDKHDEGIKEMCSTGVSFGRSDTATWSVMVDGGMK